MGVHETVVAALAAQKSADPAGLYQAVHGIPGETREVDDQYPLVPDVVVCVVCLPVCVLLMRPCCTRVGIPMSSRTG